MPTIICISGKARHGKDTFCDMLKDELEKCGSKVLVIRYADLLKYLCKDYFGWDGQKDDKGRTLLQYVGTDIVRKKNPNYWVDFVISFVKLFANEWGYVLIPDTRFPNEIDRWKDEGFNPIHVRVVRDGFDNGLSEEQKNHPSETALSDYSAHLLVHNNSDLDTLRDKAYTFCGILTALKSSQ